MARGYVYILINGSMPDFLKVGMTTLDPNERAKQLRTTGVPVHFTVAYYEEFYDCEYAERKMHEVLKTYRTSLDREFFNCPLKIAITHLQNLKLTDPNNNFESHESNLNSEIHNDTKNNRLFLPSEALSQIVGSDPITREQAITALWEYIRKNKLQDPENRRLIQCNNIIKSPHGHVASRMIVRAFYKQMRMRSVPVFHGPHRGFALERRLG
jgi:hypothetical protein